MTFMDTVREVHHAVDDLEMHWNSVGIDSFGVRKRELNVFFSMLGLAYRHYFDVELIGIDHVPARGRGMMVGNHSGGVALDGAMLLAALLLDHHPPRLAHGMADKFLNRIPFSSQWSSRCGQLTGIPEHAVRLLEDERLLMVFPEGARGTAKLYGERDSLVDFGTGFMRLALQTRSPIIPFAFVGGGEAIPTIFNSKLIGKLAGVPYVPFTPYLLPIPLPVKVVLNIGEPMMFTGNGSEEDNVIEAQVDEVKTRVRQLIAEGRQRRDRK
jgi:1-acyl-sn-glycerol-3-phosphate acyltransferase